MQWLTTFRISHQLVVALAAILLLTIGLGIYAYQEMQKIDGRVRELEKTWMPAGWSPR